MASSSKIGKVATVPSALPPGGGKGLSADDSAVGPAHEMSRYKKLIARTVDAFGDEIKASRWLSLPNCDFGGQTPLQVAQRSGYDFKAIEPILIRIEHGVEF